MLIILSSLYESAPTLLAAQGILWSCDATGTAACPELRATPSMMAALAVSLVGLDAPLIEGSFGPVTLQGLDDPHPYLVEKVLACDPGIECAGITEAELARLASAVSVYRQGPVSYLALTVEDPQIGLVLRSPADAAEQLSTAGTLVECQMPLDTQALLPRDRALHLFLSWIGELPPQVCPDPPGFTR